MTKKEVQKIVWDYYKKHGRHSLPWRKTTNPYRILVSEVMLQQTQVTRVLPKYKSFLKKFPNFTSLAHAPRRHVLIEWQGLGYNRRAKYLHQTAQEVTKGKKRLPKTYVELKTLPGVGDYTARAVCVFAHGQALPLIETNIRTVFIHHFFRKNEHVSDAELFHIAEEVLDTKHPREWNWALMDYGTFLKEQGITTHRKSTQYVKQKPFKGSDRELRGMIIRELSKTKHLTLQEFKERSNVSMGQLKKQVSRLKKENLIQVNTGGSWSL
jgi:A/G-specific adenine glycosylase